MQTKNELRFCEESPCCIRFIQLMYGKLMALADELYEKVSDSLQRLSNRPVGWVITQQKRLNKTRKLNHCNWCEIS